MKHRTVPNRLNVMARVSKPQPGIFTKARAPPEHKNYEINELLRARHEHISAWFWRLWFDNHVQRRDALQAADLDGPDHALLNDGIFGRALVLQRAYLC